MVSSLVLLLLHNIAISNIAIMKTTAKVTMLVLDLSIIIKYFKFIKINYPFIIYQKVDT